MITNVVLNNEPYFCMVCWDKTLEKIIKDKSKIPKPCVGTLWSSKTFFLEKLTSLEQSLKPRIISKTDTGCLLCKNKNQSNKIYVHKNIIWSSGLYHYIDKHNVKPPSKFIRFVLDNDPDNSNKCIGSTANIRGKVVSLNNFSYVKIKSNQLLILDALMEFGGNVKRYKEKHETGYKYSEHSGVLEFNKKILDRVIVIGTTERVKSVDPEIYVADIGDIAYKYEYIFHTHPSTPKPGGRADVGILYEFPSPNDLYHFIEKSNDGRVQGSLVITPEGLYNIRKNTSNITHIEINTTMGHKFRSVLDSVQVKSIKKHGLDFDNEYFYSVIAQDLEPINECNKLLKHYDLHIDFFPRQKTKKGIWIIGTVYLPLCSSKKI